MSGSFLDRVRIQYPTNEPESLQRAIVQIKQLLEDADFWAELGASLGDVTIRITGGTGGGGFPPTLVYWDDVLGKPSNPSVEEHIADTDNPHGVTAEDVGAYTTVQADDLFLMKSGGIMTGPITLTPVLPTDNGLRAATKQYVDDHAGSGSWDDITDKPANPTVEEHHAARDNPHETSWANLLSKPSAPTVEEHHAATDNPHQTSWDNLVNAPVEFPPAAHTHLEADITDLDKFTQQEVTDNFVADIGGEMTGNLILTPVLATDPALRAATKQYVDNQSGGGGLPDAPIDGVLYGREDGFWVPAVALTGDTMTGDLLLTPVLATDPDLRAATKRYVDENSGGPGGPGSWNTLLDKPSNPTVEEHHAATDNPHETGWGNLLDIPTAFPPAAHTHLEADITDLDKFTQQQVRDGFIATTGGVMTGPLTLNALPTLPLHAANKSYVDDRTIEWTAVTGKPANPTVEEHHLDRANPHGVTAGQLDVYVKAEVYTQTEVNDGFISINGGEVLGNLILTPVLGTDPDLRAATKKYVDDNSGGGGGPAAWDEITGKPANPTVEEHHAARDNPHQTSWTNLLSKPSAPTVEEHHAARDNPHAVTAAQIDAYTQTEAQTLFLAKTGGTMTGPITLPAAAPTNILHAVTQSYVDAAVAAPKSWTDLTDKPSNPTVEEHHAARNNPHQTGWGNLLGVPTEFPPAAHMHLEAEITDLDKYTQAEANAKFVDITGDDMTGTLTIIGQNYGEHLKLRRGSNNTGLSPWAGGQLAVDLNGTTLGVFDLPGDDVLFVDESVITRIKGDYRYLKLAGGTLTGPLTLNALPTLPLHAATKQYVDDNSGGGGTPPAPGTEYLYIYPDYDAFISTPAPASEDVAFVRTHGRVIKFSRDTTNDKSVKRDDGTRWRPADTVTPLHFGAVPSSPGDDEVDAQKEIQDMFDWGAKEIQMHLWDDNPANPTGAQFVFDFADENYCIKVPWIEDDDGTWNADRGAIRISADCKNCIVKDMTLTAIGGANYWRVHADQYVNIGDIQVRFAFMVFPEASATHIEFLNPKLNCNGMASGMMLRTRNMVHNPVIRKMGYVLNNAQGGVGLWASSGDVHVRNGWIGQWDQNDAEYYDVRTFKAIGMHCDNSDALVIGTKFRWCYDNITIAGTNNRFVQIHSFNGMRSYSAGERNTGGNGQSTGGVTAELQAAMDEHFGYPTINTNFPVRGYHGGVRILETTTGANATSGKSWDNTFDDCYFDNCHFELDTTNVRFNNPKLGSKPTSSLTFPGQKYNEWVWKKGQAVANNKLCQNNNKYYKAVGAGTTGNTPPTHTTGTVSDGGVNWAYQGTGHGPVTATAVGSPNARDYWWKVTNDSISASTLSILGLEPWVNGGLGPEGKSYKKILASRNNAGWESDYFNLTFDAGGDAFSVRNSFTNFNPGNTDWEPYSELFYTASTESTIAFADNNTDRDGDDKLRNPPSVGAQGNNLLLYSKRGIVDLKTSQGQYTFETDGELTNGTSVVTRSNGNNQYLQLSGSVAMTGTLKANDITVAGSLSLTSNNSSIDYPRTGQLRVKMNEGGTGGTATYSFEQNGELDNTTSIVTKANGDDRYLKISGNSTSTGNLTMANLTATSRVTGATLTVTGLATMNSINMSGSLTTAGISNTGSLTFTSGTITKLNNGAFTINTQNAAYTFSQSGSLGSGTDVVTRSNGNDQYVQLAGSVAMTGRLTAPNITITGALTLSGNANVSGTVNAPTAAFSGTMTAANATVTNTVKAGNVSFTTGNNQIVTVAANGGYELRINNSMNADPSNGNTIISRKGGDIRYTQSLAFEALLGKLNLSQADEDEIRALMRPEE